MSISMVSLQKISRFRTEKHARLRALALGSILARLYVNKLIEMASNLLNQVLGQNQKTKIVAKTSRVLKAVKRI